MDSCSLCLGDLKKVSYICKDYSSTNIHYSITCHHKKIYTTLCNHKFHKCCIYSYVWHQTGADCPGEEARIKCPNCRNTLNIKIEE